MQKLEQRDPSFPKSHVVWVNCMQYNGQQQAVYNTFGTHLGIPQAELAANPREAIERALDMNRSKFPCALSVLWFFPFCLCPLFSPRHLILPAVFWCATRWTP